MSGITDQSEEVAEGLTETSSVPVLVVDDDPSILQLLSEQLQNAFGDRFSVHTCVNSPDAIPLCQKLGIEIVLTDMNMDEVNGFHLLKTLKENHPLIQVVMITGLDPQNAMESARAMGADDFFTKPVEMKELGHCLQYLSRRIRRWRETIEGYHMRPTSEANVG